MRRATSIEAPAEQLKLKASAVFRQYRTRLLRIAVEEATFAKRGFYWGEEASRSRLEAIGFAFVAGYNSALCSTELGELATRLETVDLDMRGFAYEGAAMATTVLDRLSGRAPRRWRRLLQGPGEPYYYLVFVGAGSALARLPGRLTRARQVLDPFYGWLAVDGFGFHHGYFNSRKDRELEAAPARLYGYERRAFDQGLGRGLWFVHCADVERISNAILSEGVAAGRRSDLWSGVGLAATYAGPVDPDSLRYVLSTSGPHRAAVAQGAAFAAKARLRSGNSNTSTETACEALCQLAVSDAAELTDRMLPRGKEAGSEDAYELWRARIQSYFHRGQVKR